MASQPSKLEGAAERAIPRLTNWGWRMYNQPSYAPAAGETAASSTTGLAAETGTASTGGTAAATAAGESSLSGLGGSTWAAYAPYLSVLAPLLMTYQAYTAGSGENTPIRKQYETAGMGKLLYDISKGKDIDQKSLYKDYGLYPKSMPAYLDPNSYMNADKGPGAEMLDPRGYSPTELYEGMHRFGTGHRQTGGLGNSGFSDEKIDEMFGEGRGDVARTLGYANGLPDWRNTTYDASGGIKSPIEETRQRELSTTLGGMTESERGDLINRNRRWLPENDPGTLDDKFSLQMLAREREKAELEKILGYSLG